MLDDAALLTAMRGERAVADMCRADGITAAEFAAARDAYLKRRLPPTNAQLGAAVEKSIEIVRDRAGVPHVVAATTHDRYFGLGFAMAQDRLWQMDRLRRRALGRQAEVLGPAYARADLMHRLVGIDEIATAEVGRIDEQSRLILDAFVAGINRQIEACGANVPVEFALLGYTPEPFSARDSIAILRGMWWSLNGRLESIVIAEAARLLPDERFRSAFLAPEAPEERIVPAGSPYPVATMEIHPVGYPVSGSGHAGRRNHLATGMGDSSGSNNWAVSGRRTSTGEAILCGDPHQPFWLPSSWYEYALHGPEYDAAGAGHPGVPGFWWGANGAIAWGLTNNAASTRDLYVEEVHPSDPSRYRDADDWRSFAERTITIDVRGEPARYHTLRSSVRGPIMNEMLPAIADGGDPPLALRWVGQEHLDDVRALLGISMAHDWPSFRTALRDWSVAIFNFGYADRTGFVGYQCAGRVPVRGRVVRGFRRANEPADAWRGYVPFDAMPRMEGPPRGYIASANQRVAPDDYPAPLSGAWGAGYRAKRIGQALDGTGLLDRERLVALQNDVKSCRAESLRPALLRRLAGANDSDVRMLSDTLAAWDDRYTLDSTAPTLFESFVQVWQERVAAERFPERLVSLVKGQGGAAARLLVYDDLDWFAGGTTAAVVAAARQSMAQVRAHFGDDPAGWRWGVVHQAHWRHPLSNDATAAQFDVGPLPVDGGNDTVRNTGVGTPPFSASGGAEYRIAVDFADPERFWAVQNVGNSGQPGSTHYADQFGPWVAGSYHVVELRRAALHHETEGRTTLAPGTEPAP